MSIEQEIKDYTLQVCQMDMVGISGVDRMDGSISGRHPCDILPGAKSMIVYGLGLTDGAVQAIFRFYEEGKRNVHGIYGTYGYTITPNFQLMWTAHYLSRFIEKKTGCVAVPIPTGPMQNGAPLSLRHAAVAAGLGAFGWQSLVLTPEFGPRNRFGAVLTQMELEPDPMYDGPPLCDPSKCQICVEKCTPGAISPYTGPGCARGVDMVGKHFDYAYVNWTRCRVGSMGFHTKAGGAEDLVSWENPTAKECEQAEAHIAETDGSLQRAPTWKCGLCIAYCPAGKWKERYQDNGLSVGKHRFQCNQPGKLNDQDGEYSISTNSTESVLHGDFHPDASQVKK